MTAWDRIRTTLRGGFPLSVVVVGGGAGGVELAAAMQYRFRKEAWSAPMRLVLVGNTESLLPEHPARAQRIFERVLRQRGIEACAETRVTRIFREASRNGIAAEDDWIWRLKDAIDRRFMATHRIAST